MLAPYPGDHLHNQHPPPPASQKRGQPNRAKTTGSILDAYPQPAGSKLRRNTRARAELMTLRKPPPTSRSSGRSWAHEVGIATGHSDGRDVSDGDRGRDEERADEGRLLLHSH